MTTSTLKVYKYTCIKHSPDYLDAHAPQGPPGPPGPPANPIPPHHNV